MQMSSHYFIGLFIGYVICTTILIKTALGEGQLKNGSCLDARHHKKQPGPEDQLHGCNPWKENSCCTNITALGSVTDGSELYKFNHSHCKKMSSKCMKWFSLNNCFYECSPNLGPWMVKVENSKYRNQKVSNVPLCKSQCEEWWDACKNESTCTEHWNIGFEWNKTGNHCPSDKPCVSFTEMFNNATYFCHNIYGPYDYKVMDDDKQCMNLSFAGTNPNKQVTEYYANISSSTSTPSPSVHKNDSVVKASTSTKIPPATSLVTSKANLSGTPHESISPYVHPNRTPPLQVNGTVASVVVAVLILTIAAGIVVFLVVRHYRRPPFRHQSAPTQFPGSIMRSARFSPAPTSEEDQLAEMSFMQYEDEEDVDEGDAEKLNAGNLRMKL